MVDPFLLVTASARIQALLEAASDTSHAPVFRHTLSELVQTSPDISSKCCQIAGHLCGQHRCSSLRRTKAVPSHPCYTLLGRNHRCFFDAVGCIERISANRLGASCRRRSGCSGPGLKRLYVSAESGIETVFQETDRGLRLLGQFKVPHAHTVLVDLKTHLAYFPLENIDGHPLLRIVKPSVLP
jgi:hypothetical protein